MTHFIRLYLPILTIGCFPALAQIAGQNVNMVSGTQWPNGDPFLQRQNEPSIAISTRNPLHLLAGANDYRTVDLPGLPVGETGDAWLGIFKSYDGGQTWTSTVHPGCLQNVPQCGGAPALKGFGAAADPVVRPGANGMFFYSGIVFTRAATSKSSVFVSRFIDNNNEENGDPIKYIDSTVVSSAASGTFVDKPWLAVDVPRSGAGSCTVKSPQPIGAPISQTFPAGNIYVAYTTFVNEDQPPSQVMFTRSTDCGLTWSNPVGLSDTTVNQGAAIAIDPVSGAVYVAWRRFKNGNLSDAILLVKSTNGGQTFSAPVQVAAINNFDQATSAYSFRTNDYPSLTVDGSGRVYVVWAQRNAGQAASGGDARIVISTSRDAQAWTPPSPVNDFPGRGHQFMPSITFGGGNIFVVFYDLREDSTVGNFSAIGGGQYVETRVPAGDLATTPAHPEKIFTPFILDAAPANLMEGGLLRRHTVDVWGALASAADTPSFTATRVSQYEFGSLPNASVIEQLQVDPPNFPLFSQGTEPFFGDYLDVAAAPTMVPGPQGTWKFNTDASTSVVFHPVWTDNRDVRPPADGDWTHYTPPVSASVTGTSIYDPTQPQPVCVTGQTGMRNQNIYTATVTQGLVVSSPSNAKTLGTLQRAFPVVIQNTTNRARSYRLTIVSQPPGGLASFLENPVAGLPNPLTSLDISVGPISSASRMVFVTSNNPAASVQVVVAEIVAPGADAVLPGGQTGTVLLNPDPLNPDNPVTSTNDIFSPALSSPGIANPDIANPDIANPDIANPDIANPDIANPDIANLGVANPDIANPDIANPDIANPDIANPDIANAAITDAVWPLINNGNTAATYSLHFILDKLLPRHVKAQLLITKNYSTPVANGCTLVTQPRPVVVANTSHPQLTRQMTLSRTKLGKVIAYILRAQRGGVPLGPADAGTADVTDSSSDNTTVTIGSGETVYVTLRFFNTDSSLPLGFNPGTDITTVSIAQSINTGNTQPSIAASKLFAASGELPPALVGSAYDATLQAAGGTQPYTWSIVSGTLPPGLSLNTSSGKITGTPSGPSQTYSFSVQVTDSSNPSASVTESLSIPVTAVALSIANLAASGPNGTNVKAGDTVTVTASIADSGSAATAVSPVVGIVATGTASTTCSPPSPAAADIAAGGNQTYTIQCGNVSGAGTLAFSVSITGTDPATGASVSVTPATSNAITVQGTPPGVAVSATTGGAAYTAGQWTNKPVVVTFTCTPASGSPSTQTVTVTSQGSNQTVTTTCTDTAGNSTPASFSGIDIDLTPPVITAGATANGSAYTGAVVNQPVTVTFNCTDSGGSGVASVTPPITFSNTGLNQSASGTCKDVAGNSTTVSYSPINIIIGTPQLTATMTSGGKPYVAGAWSALPVAVTFNCLIAGGLTPQSLTPPATVAQGTNQFVSGTCVDQAGNSATVTVGPINVDTGAPSLSVTSITPAATGGWYKSPVTITWLCKDPVDGTNTTISKTVSTEGANQTVTASCTNLAGTPATASQSVSIDLTPPVITASASSQPNTNGWYNTAVTVTFSCSDALSGVAQNATPQTLAQDGTGLTATGTCTDVAGNSASTTYGPVKIDRTPPTVQLLSVTPAPNASGWNNGPVTVSWTCSDSGSGPAAGTVSQTLSQNGAGQSATGTCTDLAGNTASATRSGINIDTSMPIATATPSSQPNGSGWWAIPVTVTFSCSDSVSGVTQTPPAQTFSSNIKGATATATCTSVAGNTATATYGPINIDTTPPTIQFVSIAPAPNGNGWNSGPVTVTWSCSDSGSGPVAATVTQVLSQNGAGQSATATCTDLAGNTVSNTRSGINIDATLPTVTATPSSQPNSNGWWAVPVTVTFSCADSVSGVASQPAAQTFSANVKGATATGTCTSIAGTTGTGTYGPINIDMSPPVITFSGISPAPNGIWNNSPVTLTWACSDAVSGPVSATVSQFVTKEGAGQSATGTCTNLAGGTASNTQSINIDETPPQIQLISPVNGFTYTQGTTIAASYTCSDGLSGVASCTGSLPNGTRTTLNTTGSFSFTVTATDHAGNQTTTTSNYTVVPPKN